MYNITKQEAEQFLKDLDVGDDCALTELIKSISARVVKNGGPLPDADKTINFCKALDDLSWVIVGMESGTDSWDGALIEWYREGVHLLIEECTGRN